MTLSGAVCGCEWNYSINSAIINFVYCAVCVHVCVSVSELHFYCSAGPKMPPWE